MGGARATRDVEITQQAEEKIDHAPGWRDYFGKYITELRRYPEPDGKRKDLAAADSPYADSLVLDEPPWQIFYQTAEPNRLIIVAVELQPYRPTHAD